ncbi:extracellular solute-binding protein [Telmatospirillum sp.]|uniref:ABC transporter substrate-binding protein n=1 Tax=Telmatospirillum sp. TaxID=2079197 RepID=UPI00283B5D10|nr:extracellular solute-binding protein [Telmatospirillum sp.]MDR3438764.1 extracellular solute-binding protein [Telmatospirillum sp.]
MLSCAALALVSLLATSAFAETVKILSIEPNVTSGREFYADAAKAFEAANPGVTIQFDYLDDTSFKSKLPTLLQSSTRPDAFYTWTGGVFHEQADAGVLKDISGELDSEFKATLAPIGLDAMTYKGKTYGVPMYAASVTLWYNKDLTDKAGVDPAKIKTWDDFLSAVKVIKAAGITPIIVGGKGKWPLAFYYGYLITRIVGTDGIVAANTGVGGGFASDNFVRAGAEFKRLTDLQPFQSGFMDTDNNKALGLFGDGKGAFELMGNFIVGTQRKNSTSGQGIAPDKLGFIPFPAVAGGRGNAADTFGGVNGWLVTKNASPLTVKWLKFLVNKENQEKSASLGLWLPIVKGTQSAIPDPGIRGVAELLTQAPHHQLYLDQAFGASVGSALNDAAAELATGDVDAKSAAAKVEDARQLR